MEISEELSKYYWFNFLYHSSIGLPRSTTIISKRITILHDDPCPPNREFETHYEINAVFDDTALQTFTGNDELHWRSDDEFGDDESYAVIVSVSKTHDGKGMKIIIKKHRGSFFDRFGEEYDCN